MQKEINNKNTDFDTTGKEDSSYEEQTSENTPSEVSSNIITLSRIVSKSKKYFRGHNCKGNLFPCCFYENNVLKNFLVCNRKAQTKSLDVIYTAKSNRTKKKKDVCMETDLCVVRRKIYKNWKSLQAYNQHFLKYGGVVTTDTESQCSDSLLTAFKSTHRFKPNSKRIGHLKPKSTKITRLKRTQSGVTKLKEKLHQAEHQTIELVVQRMQEKENITQSTKILQEEEFISQNDYTKVPEKPSQLNVIYVLRQKKNKELENRSDCELLYRRVKNHVKSISGESSTSCDSFNEPKMLCFPKGFFKNFPNEQSVLYIGDREFRDLLELETPETDVIAEIVHDVNDEPETQNILLPRIHSDTSNVDINFVYSSELFPNNSALSKDCNENKQDQLTKVSEQNHQAETHPLKISSANEVFPSSESYYKNIKNYCSGNFNKTQSCYFGVSSKYVTKFNAPSQKIYKPNIKSSLSNFKKKACNVRKDRKTIHSQKFGKCVEDILNCVTNYNDTNDFNVVINININEMINEKKNDEVSHTKSFIDKNVFTSTIFNDRSDLLRIQDYESVCENNNNCELKSSQTNKTINHDREIQTFNETRSVAVVNDVITTQQKGNNTDSFVLGNTNFKTITPVLTDENKIFNYIITNAPPIHKKPLALNSSNTHIENDYKYLDKYMDNSLTTNKSLIYSVDNESMSLKDSDKFQHLHDNDIYTQYSKKEMKLLSRNYMCDERQCSPPHCRDISIQQYNLNVPVIGMIRKSCSFPTFDSETVIRVTDMTIQNSYDTRSMAEQTPLKKSFSEQTFEDTTKTMQRKHRLISFVCDVFPRSDNTHADGVNVNKNEVVTRLDNIKENGEEETKKQIETIRTSTRNYAMEVADCLIEIDPQMQIIRNELCVTKSQQKSNLDRLSFLKKLKFAVKNSLVKEFTSVIPAENNTQILYSLNIYKRWKYSTLIVMILIPLVSIALLSYLFTNKNVKFVDNNNPIKKSTIVNLAEMGF